MIVNNQIKQLFEEQTFLPSIPEVPPIIGNYITAKSRFKWCYSGRRCFKTEGGFRQNYIKALSTKDIRIVLGAPTHQQVKKIFWDKVKKHFKPFIKDKSESELKIKLLNNTQVELFGLDRPERIEGAYLHHIHIAESANVKQDAWYENIFPALSDRTFIGTGIFDGTPDRRFPHFKDLVLRASSDGRIPETHPTKGVSFANGSDMAFSWHSSLLLPKSEIEEAKSKMDDLTFRQEYQGEFVETGGVVYYGYTQDSNTNEVYNPNRNTIVTFDFNINPMTAIVLQEVSNDYWVAVKEFVLSNANTEQTCDVLIDYFQTNTLNGTLRVTGDYAGTQRSTSASVGSLSDWNIIDRKLSLFRGYQKKIRPTLSIKDRTMALNSMFKTSDGTVKLRVNKDFCPELSNDLLKQTFDKDGRLDDANGKIGHRSDALSYFAYNFYPIEINPYKFR